MPRKCKADGCSKRPSFNFSGELVPLYCAAHSHPNMVDVFSKFCQYEGCRTHPSFNYPALGRKVGVFCASHKLEGMVDVRSRRCDHEGCTSFPTFNYMSERPGRFCSKHKFPDMMDVRRHTISKCSFHGCHEASTFNFPGKKGTRFCYEHKLDGMVSKKTTCKYEKCERQPMFNYLGCPKPLYCALHALVHMVPITGYPVSSRPDHAVPSEGSSIRLIDDANNADSKVIATISLPPSVMASIEINTGAFQPDSSNEAMAVTNRSTSPNTTGDSIGQTESILCRKRRLAEISTVIRLDEMKDFSKP